MKTKKIVKALEILKKHCENSECEDCIFCYYADKPKDDKCYLDNIPLDYDIKEIKKSLKGVTEMFR